MAAAASSVAVQRGIVPAAAPAVRAAVPTAPTPVPRVESGPSIVPTAAAEPPVVLTPVVPAPVVVPPPVVLPSSAPASTPAPAFKPIAPARGGTSAGRVFNGLCYVGTGVAVAIAAAVGAGGPWFIWLAALFLVGYGVKILVTRTSYWINTVIYLLPVFAVAYLFFKLSGH
jgi:hypothetical protein